MIIQRYLSPRNATVFGLAAAFFACQLQNASGDGPLDNLPPPPGQFPPAAPSSAPNSTNSEGTSENPAALQRISSAVPSYTDRGTAMVPLRAVAEFAGCRVDSHENLIVLSRDLTPPTPDATELPNPTEAPNPGEPAAPDAASSGTPANNVENKLLITLRVGSTVVQVQDRGRQAFTKLPLPVEKRLGIVFTPLRSLVSLLGGSTVHVAANDINIIVFGDRRGYISAVAQDGYRGADAARLTIVNRTGRALSLRLNGPQKLAIELGRSQSITRSVRPGVYYYKAAAVGLKTHGGVRRLLAGHKATWSWGRR